MTALFAAISISGLINLLIYILVLGLIVWLALYVISVLPLPEPFNQVARVIVMVLAVIVLIMLILQLVGVATGPPLITP